MDAFAGATVLTLVLSAALFFSPEPILVRNEAEKKDPFYASRHQLQKVAEESREVGHAAGEVLGGAGNRVSQISEEVVQITKEKVGEAAEALQHAVEGAAERVQEAGAAKVHSMKEAASHTVHSTLDSTASVGHKMFEVTKEKVGEVSGAAHKVVEAAAERLHDAGAAAVGTVKEAASHVAQTSHDTADHAKDKVECGIECAVEAVEAAANATRRGASKAAHYIKEIPVHTAESASAAFHTVKDAVCHKVEEVCESQPVKELQGGGRGVYKELVEEEDNMRECLMEELCEAKEGAGDLLTRVKESTTEATQGARDIAGRRLPETSGWFERLVELPTHIAARVVSLISRAEISTGADDRSKQSPHLPKIIIRLVHLVAFAVAFGASVWNIFIAGAPLAHLLTVSQFVYVQSRLFATYFKMTGISNTFVLLSYTMLHPLGAAGPSEKFETMILFLNLLCSLVNLFWLQPYAYRVESVNFLFMKLVSEKLQLDSMNASSSKHLHRGEVPAGPEEMNGVRSLPATPPPSPEVPVHTQVDRGIGPSLQALERRSFLMVHMAPATFNLFCFFGLVWHAWYLVHVLAL